jgi:hypothetical protein
MRRRDLRSLLSPFTAIKLSTRLPFNRLTALEAATPGSAGNQYAINVAKGREEPHSAIERPRDIFSTHGCHSNNARSLVWLDGNTIAKSNNSPGIGGDTLTRNNNPGEIQRIRRRDSYDFTGWLLIARGTQGLYRHRQSKLLSQKATNESATPNFAAIFQAPQGY